MYVGVGYYLDANVPRTLQRAVGIAQIVLELLVYSVKVDGTGTPEEELKPIGRGIARLLDHFGISTDIPANLAELTREANREGWNSDRGR